MSQDNLFKLVCSSCKRANYFTNKNRRKVERKLKLKKFCKFCRKHTVHNEAKRK